MNEQIVNYLTSNRDKYPRAVLTSMLVKSGYNPKEIEDAAAMVFGGATISTDGTVINAPFNFWDFNARIVYESTPQRRKDFWFGFWTPTILTIILGWIPSGLIYLSGMGNKLAFVKNILGGVRSILGLVIFIGIFYLWNRRRSISYGIITGYVFYFFMAIVLAGVLLAGFLGLAGFNF